MKIKECNKRRGTKKAARQKTINKMKIVSLSLSIITLNVNGLNAPIKKHRLAQ